MNESMRLLKSDIEADEALIAQNYDKLSVYETPPREAKDVIVVGYYLHNLYTAFEHLCTLIAEAFENRVEDRAHWHTLLLRRMTQDIEGIRPRLFSDETFYCLNELRSFRHVFRSAYGISLDPDRLALVFHRAQVLLTLYPEDVAKFKAFLESL